MGRRHAEPVEVRRRDGVPEQFLWRSRLYVVRDVLEHWFESSRWWASERAMVLASGSDTGEAVGGLTLTPMPASPRWAQRAWGEPAPDVGVSAVPVPLDDAEQEFWRVEARAGSGASPGVYDLSFDWSSGCWLLVEVHD